MTFGKSFPQDSHLKLLPPFMVLSFSSLWGDLSMEIMLEIGKVWNALCKEPAAECKVLGLTVKIIGHNIYFVFVHLLSHFWLFATPWAIALQASLSFIICTTKLYFQPWLKLFIHQIPRKYWLCPKHGSGDLVMIETEKVPFSMD